MKMPHPHHITREVFIRTFPRLVVGRSFLPKKRNELQVLLTSVASAFEFDQDYVEGQVNELILEWVLRFGNELGTDHVTLRRYLVDEGVLKRDEFGSAYQLASEIPFFSYDLSIRDLDLEALMAQANEEREARKRTFLASDQEAGRGDEA